MKFNNFAYSDNIFVDYRDLRPEGENKMHRLHADSSGEELLKLSYWKPFAFQTSKLNEKMWKMVSLWFPIQFY